MRPGRSDAAFTDLLLAALDGTGVTAVEEIDGGAIRAFFTSRDDRDRAAQDVVAAFPGTAVEPLDVSDENWAERSQASLRAVKIGELTVAPPWDVPSEHPEKTVVILPSMGFGTGHHATTRLCLAALQEAAPAGKTVIDVGTGSGVLAIAAAKLGASSVVGIDNDPDAITNALENRALNAGACQLAVHRSNLDDQDLAAEGPFDLVVANLTGGVLIKFAATLERYARNGGGLVLSGLREEEERDVLAAFRAKLTARTVEDGWVCLVLRR